MKVRFTTDDTGSDDKDWFWGQIAAFRRRNRMPGQRLVVTPAAYAVIIELGATLGSTTRRLPDGMVEIGGIDDEVFHVLRERQRVWGLDTISDVILRSYTDGTYAEGPEDELE